MRAIVVRQFGGAENLVLKEVEDPQVGPEELLVRVRATAVNRADISQRIGKYPSPPGASSILGLEMAGEVLEVGSAVGGWEPGERVFSILTGGGYAQMVTVPAAHAMKLPSTLSFHDAAAVPEAFLTAYRSLIDLGGLESGNWVLVHAGGSGVGSAAIQLAKFHGASVVTTAGSPAKLAACRELGADVVIDYRAGSFVPATREATNGQGVDVIIDLIGGPYAAQNLDVLAKEGSLVVVGVLGGTEAVVDLGQLMRQNWTVTGGTLRNQPVAYKASLTERFWSRAASAFEQRVL